MPCIQRYCNECTPGADDGKCAVALNYTVILRLTAELRAVYVCYLKLSSSLRAMKAKMKASRASRMS